MLELIKDYYRNPNIDKINFPIINRQYEKSLEDYVVDCFQSISSVLTEIRMVDHKFIVDVDKVNQTDYERVRSNRTKDQKQKYVYMADSRLGELNMKFEVDYEFDGKPGEIETIEGKPGHLEYTVRMLIPVPDENNCFFIKGKRYNLQYQITESSTYTTSSALVGKSLLPIKILRDRKDEKDTENQIIKLPNYKVLVFNKYENFLFFFFATKGWYGTLEYFDVGKYFGVVENKDIGADPNYRYFKVNNEFGIKVLRKALDISDYIQAMTGSILEVMSNRMSISDIFNKNYWICRIGAFKTNVAKESQYELGKRHIILFNRMLDEGTKYSLRLADHNKHDVYAIVRWMIQEYKNLWEKDNLDLVNKRLRCNEYVASLLNAIISEKIKKFVNTTVNKEEKLIIKYNNFFSFRGNEIISKLHSSGLLRFDDTVNDMDFFERLKVTQKGPNSVGNKSDSKTISSKRRALHPSHLLRLDLNVCGSSDPGLNNYLSPFCETDGLYFKGATPEPETFLVEFRKEMMENEDGTTSPILIMDPVKYNDMTDEIDSITIDGAIPKEIMNIDLNKPEPVEESSKKSDKEEPTVSEKEESVTGDDSDD